MNYKKCKVVRVKELNRAYFEVILTKEHLTFKPGNKLKILPHGKELYIASGVGYPQIQLILDKQNNEDLYLLDYLGTKPSIKVEGVLDSFDTLYKDINPGFIISGEGINVALSYISTYPDRKVEIVYLDDNPILLDWLRAKELLKTEIYDLDKDKNYYVCGERAIYNSMTLDKYFKLVYNNGQRK